MLPKALLGTVRDVDRFIAASGFAGGRTQSGAALPVFEAIGTKPDGLEQREFVAILARSGCASPKVGSYTLKDEPIGQIEPQPAR